MEKIETKTLREKAYAMISNSIMAGEMLPGQKFSLRSLSARLGVSTMPVREALWQLETEKVIIIESNRQMLINSINRRDLEDLFELRTFLESELAVRACAVRTDETINNLSAIYRNIEASIVDVTKYLHWNKEFHFLLYKTGGVGIYLDTVRSLWLRIAPYFAIQNQSPASHIQLDPHKAMLDSLIASDKARMADAIRWDLESAKLYISNHIE